MDDQAVSSDLLNTLVTQAGPCDRGLFESLKKGHPKGKVGRELHVHTCFHLYVILLYVKYFIM